MNITAKQQRLIRYNDIITTNKTLFKAGSTMTRDSFVFLFKIPDIVNTGTYEEVHRANLKLVRAQMEINRLMRENGLYLESNNYYNSFSVVKKPKTKKTIVRYSAEVDINNYCTTRLETKLQERVKAKTWGTYNKVSRGVILNMDNNYKTERHKATINRVKSY
jgi:hypothetical protein